MKHRCPACLERTLDERGEYDICSYCRWEDDPHQRHDPLWDHQGRDLSPNFMSLIEGVGVAIAIANRRFEPAKAVRLQRYRERLLRRPRK